MFNRHDTKKHLIQQISPDPVVCALCGCPIPAGVEYIKQVRDEDVEDPADICFCESHL